MDVCAFRCGTEIAGVAVAVCLADGVAAGGERHGLLVVHRHASEGDAHVVSGAQRVALAAHSLRVHVDETHLHRGERVLERVAIVALVALGCEPLALLAPVDVLLRMPDVLATEAVAEGLQTHRLVRHVAGEDHEVGPADLVPVLLLDRPQQTSRLVQVRVVRPRVERCEAQVAGVGATATIGRAIGARCVPRHADHETAVVAPVGRPPVLAVGHQLAQVFLERLHIERAHFLAVVEVLAKRVRLRVVLVEDVEVQRLGPPCGGGLIGVHVRTMCDRALSCALFCHCSVLFLRGLGGCCRQFFVAGLFALQSGQ